jgi:hypothetical protein
MKVTITHLKAPWPPGAQPGDVVELVGDVVPAWAVNKCEPAADDAPVFGSAAAGKPATPAQGAVTAPKKARTPKE